MSDSEWVAVARLHGQNVAHRKMEPSGDDDDHQEDEDVAGRQLDGSTRLGSIGYAALWSA